MEFNLSPEREKELAEKIAGAIKYLEGAYGVAPSPEQALAWLERHISDEQFKIFMKRVGVFTVADLAHWKSKMGVSNEDKAASESAAPVAKPAGKPGRPRAVKPVEPEAQPRSELEDGTAEEVVLD